MVGKRLQGADPSNILLYRGGSKVLASPVISTSSRTFRGPSLACSTLNGNNRGRIPVATNKSIGPCGSKYATSHTARSTTASMRAPVPNSLNENFLANRATLPGPQTFRESNSSFQIPQQGSCEPKRRGVKTTRSKCNQKLPTFFSTDPIESFYPTDFGYGAPGGTAGRGPRGKIDRKAIRKARRHARRRAQKMPVSISCEIEAALNTPVATVISVNGVRVPQ